MKKRTIITLECEGIDLIVAGSIARKFMTRHPKKVVAYSISEKR